MGEQTKIRFEDYVEANVIPKNEGTPLNKLAQLHRHVYGKAIVGRAVDMCLVDKTLQYRGMALPKEIRCSEQDLYNKIGIVLARKVSLAMAIMKAKAPPFQEEITNSLSDIIKNPILRIRILTFISVGPENRSIFSYRIIPMLGQGKKASYYAVLEK